ncbi:MAG: phage baseplate assembly protein V [Pseudomonadota bacterium]|nr:MAG: hypothetical protein DIU74_01155 [Pseudomonadota bacterium]
MFGLHRAKVVDSYDPQGELRLRLLVPDVLGDRTIWAWPWVSGPCLSAPEAGSSVWVWFEEDDVERALWLGAVPL